MALATTHWDSAEHLKTEEDIQLYLEACLEEARDDPAFIMHTLNVVARARNMSRLVEDTGPNPGCSEMRRYVDFVPCFSLGPQSAPEPSRVTGGVIYF